MSCPTGAPKKGVTHRTFEYEGKGDFLEMIDLIEECGA